MLTSRAYWFLLSVLAILSLGLLRPSLTLTLLGLALLLWFAAQWLWFLIRLPRVRGLAVEREVWDERSTVATLWAGQIFEVRLRLIDDDWLPSPHVAADDLLSYAVEQVDGSAVAQGVVSVDRPLQWAYRIRCGSAGLARFEGVRLRIADWQGFFHHLHFLHDVVVLPILPVLAPLSSQPASKKRHNLLLPPGIHRFRRPGSGSELLDLRDYLPGDPPKTIAWKVSARRDRLITKEFESEVPVRCTLFIDTSNSVRVPAACGALAPRVHSESRSDSATVQYGKALDRLIDVAAGVLQANAGVRDLTGLCLFDEQGAQNVAPDRGGAHRTECLRLLAAAAARLPVQERVPPDHLLPLAYSFASEVYPELLRPAVNAVPWTMTWLEGFSSYPRRPRLGLFEHLHRRKSGLRMLCWWASFWSLLLPLVLLLLRVMFQMRALDAVLPFVLFVGPLLSFLMWGGTVFVFGVDAVAGGGKRRRDRWRKQLAAIVSARYGLAPGGLATLLEDDDAFALLLQRFLSEHQVPYTLPLYSPEGRYLFAAPEKVPVLADALVRAVGKGRDNELFVLLADLLELEEDALDPLLRAVRVALGRHHQVVLICPWPPGLELPPSPDATRSVAAVRSHAERGNEKHVWDQVTTRRFHLAYQRLRYSFTRMGVAVLCAAGDEPVSLILRRLERLRNLGRPHS